MPTYEYRCKDCGDELEAVQAFTDDPLTECPTCGGTLKKKFSAVGISFKGGGFYKTDSRPSGGSKGSGGSSADGSAAASSDSTTTSSSDTSSPAATPAKDSSPASSPAKDSGGSSTKSPAGAAASA